MRASRYDAFGALQQLTVHTLNADRRADQYFGRYIKQRSEGSQSVINRRIPVPGAVATVHGPMTGNWTFAFGEARGTRFVTDQTGAFVQEVSYQPFGEAVGKVGATPGTTNYENEQWNGGDLLAAFGVVNLGARVYDPVIGRFLSRDPILQASNPYAFAGNDPVNSSDPTGMLQCTFCHGDAGDAPGGGGDNNGGVIQNIGAPGAANPFGDKGFTRNGGTSASGAGAGDPWGRSGSSGRSGSLGGTDLFPFRATAATAIWGLIPLFPDDQALWLLYGHLTNYEQIEVSGKAPEHGEIRWLYMVDEGWTWQHPDLACRGNSICPEHWEGTTPPPGTGPYFSHNGEVGFHCGGKVFVENRCQPSGFNFFGSILHGECVYDSDGTCRESGGLDKTG